MKRIGVMRVALLALLASTPAPAKRVDVDVEIVMRCKVCKERVTRFHGDQWYCLKCAKLVEAE